MQRICTASGQPFEITPEDLEFYKKVSPKIGDKIFDIPPPTLCPDERQRRRLMWRNERKLYRRKCDFTGKDIISIFSPDKPWKVYDTEFWWSDKWEAKAFGRDFDFSKSFFEQFYALRLDVPLPALRVHGNDNSDFTNLTSYDKNCYLIVAASENEDCMYSTYMQRCRNVIDSLFIFDSELCYECIDCYSSYRLFYSEICQRCSDSYFLFGCQSCRNCFGCAGLVNKEYHIFNKSYRPEEYHRELAKILAKGNFDETIRQWQEVRFSTPVKYYAGFQNESCTGDHLSFSKNATDCFDCTYLEDSKFCTWLHKSKDCYDCYAWGLNGELGYENHLCGDTFYNLQFCDCCTEAMRDSRYSYYCSNSLNLFGCVGLRHQQYCILNKQYSKEEYEVLVPKIIEHMRQTPLNPPLSGGKSGEWGEFFPGESAPFAYNETVAQEYFPLTKEEVLTKGWQWRDEIIEIPKVEKIIPAKLLPASIADIPDDILNWAIECEETGRPFIVQKSELEFYRKMQLPIPHFHPDIRHAHRLAKRNPRKLWQRNCDNCGKSIQTTYNPSRPEKVFCEECYQKAVY